MENVDVWKQKYRNGSTEIEVRIGVQCLTDSQLCVLRPCSQRVTLSLQCEIWILGSRTAASVAITKHVTAC